MFGNPILHLALVTFVYETFGFGNVPLFLKCQSKKKDQYLSTKK